MQGSNIIVFLGKVQHNNAVALDFFGCQLGRELLGLILSLAIITLVVSALLLLVPWLVRALSLKVLMASLEVLISSLISIILMMPLHIQLLLVVLLLLRWD